MLLTFPLSVRRLAAGAVMGGYVYVVGGTVNTPTHGEIPNVERLLLNASSSAEWVEVAPMGRTRQMHACGVVRDQRLYCTGAYAGDNTAEVYDASTNVWTSIASMSQKRYGHAAVGFGDRLYVFGGNYRNYDLTPTCEMYDPGSDSWSNLATPPSLVVNVAGAALGSYIYLTGGYTGGSAKSLVQRYNPHTDEWNLVAPMAAPRSDHGAATVQGYLYVVGGTEGTLAVERYDATNDTWSHVRSFPAPGVYSAPVVVGWG